MRSGTHFEIEIEAHDAADDKVIRVGSEAEVLAFATESLRPGVVFLVACLGAGVDLGNLTIEVDEGGLCNLRALEHRGLFVRGVSVKQALRYR